MDDKNKTPTYEIASLQAKEEQGHNVNIELRDLIESIIEKGDYKTDDRTN